MSRRVKLKSVSEEEGKEISISLKPMSQSNLKKRHFSSPFCDTPREYQLAVPNETPRCEDAESTPEVLDNERYTPLGLGCSGFRPGGWFPAI